MSDFSESTLQILREAGWYPNRSVSTDAFEAILARDGYYINDTIREFLREFGGLTLNIKYSRRGKDNKLIQNIQQIPIGTFDATILSCKFNLFSQEDILHGEGLIPIACDSDVTFVMTHSGKVFSEIDGILDMYPGSPCEFIENICGRATGRNRYFVKITDDAYEDNGKIAFSDDIRTDDNLKYLLDRSPRSLLAVDDVGYDSRWWKLYGLTMYIERLRKYSTKDAIQKTNDFLDDFIKLCPQWLPFFVPSSPTYRNKSFLNVPTFDTLCEAIAEGNLSARGSMTTFCNVSSLPNNFQKFLEIQMQLEAEGINYDWLLSSVRFPPRIEENKQITSKEFIKKVFDLFLKHWRPKNGHVTPSLSLIKRYTGIDIDAVGWLTYISNGLGGFPQLPDWVKIIPAEGYGTYLQVSDDLPNYENESEFREIAGKIYELSKILTSWLRK